MFRHKDRFLKTQRLVKKKNNTKDRPKELELKEFRGGFFTKTKVYQMILEKEFDIKIHKIHLRYLTLHNYHYFIETNLDKLDKPIGNTTYRKLGLAIKEINKRHKMSEKNQHDMTKWRKNKNKTKEMSRKRNIKTMGIYNARD